MKVMQNSSQVKEAEIICIAFEEVTKRRQSSSLVTL